MEKSKSRKLIATFVAVTYTLFYMASCDEPTELIDLSPDVTTSMKVDIKVTIDKDNSEYEVSMPKGITIPIDVTTGKSYQWVSLNPNIAYVKNDSITSVNIGNVDIIDRGNSSTTIHVSVTEE